MWWSYHNLKYHRHVIQFAGIVWSHRVMRSRWPYCRCLTNTENNTLGSNIPERLCWLRQIFAIPKQSGRLPKVVALFSATNISSNIAWLLQLHDTIQMRSNYTWINYTHDNIAIRSHIMINKCLWNLIFGTKFSSFYLAKGEQGLVFRLSFVNPQRAKDGTHMFDAKYRCGVCCIYLIKSHAWYQTSLIIFSK